MTKKSIALEMLGPLVAQNLNRTLTEKTLSGIGDDPWVDSELEKLFPEAISLYSGSDIVNGKRIKVVKDIVNGKNGQRLIIGNQQLTIEPHVQLGPAHGVQVKCEPDFIVRSEQKGITPIAIFLDGYEFHKDIVDIDLQKRQSLMQAGYIVWSLSWYDVAFSMGSSSMDLPVLSQYRNPSCHEPAIQNVASKIGAEGWQSELSFTGMDRFMRLIAGVSLSLKNHAWLFGLSLFDQRRLIDKTMNSEVSSFINKLPSLFSANWPVECQINTKATLFSNDHFTVAFAATPTDFSTGEPKLASMVLYYEEVKPGSEAERKQWQLFWQLVNVFQFMPNFLAVTKLAIEKGSLSKLEFFDGATSNPPVKIISTNVPEWIEHVHDSLKASLTSEPELWNLGVVVGYELENDEGELVAEAELAIPDLKMCILVNEQTELADSWVSHGWEIVSSVNELSNITSVSEDV